MRCSMVGLYGVVLLSAADWCAATGFYVPQQTAYGAGRANAGNVAMAREASTLFFNPAGMTQLDGAEVLVGVNIVMPSDRFENQGTTLSAPATGGNPFFVLGGSGQNPGSPTPVASLFYARPLGARWWAGVGITSPFGLRLEYDSDWFGRYDSIESELITLDVAPTLAYRLSSSVSVGAGLNLQYANTTLTSALPNTLSPNALSASADGRSELTGDAFSAGFNIGLLWSATPATRIGLHYRSRMDHDIDGESTVSGLTGPLAGANGKVDISTKLKLPDVLSVGLAQELGDRTTVLAEAQWFGWSRFDELRVEYANGAPDSIAPQGYRDTYTFSAGLEHRWRDNLTFRAGLQYDRTPTVDQFRSTAVPDGDRIWTGLGFSYRPHKRTEFTVSYQHVFIDDPEIDRSGVFYGDSVAQGEVVTRGRVDASVDTISIAFRYSL
ncbi:MAG: outer membrane protein transport protein [Thiohalocapsa sp.]